MIKEISVFFPVFNEEKSLYATVIRAREVLNKNFENWEIIIVNDGSTDETAGEISKLESLDGRIKTVKHPANRGYGAAFRTGVYNCQYGWISFTDSDGQFDFSEILNFIETQDKTGADLVIGYYLKRSVPLYRKLNTFAWQTVVNLLFDLNVRDIDCGFKMLSKKVIDAVPRFESERGAFISTELLVKAKKAGFKIVEAGVHHYPRKTGSGTGSNVDVILRSFIDLFKLWRKL